VIIVARFSGFKTFILSGSHVYINQMIHGTLNALSPLAQIFQFSAVTSNFVRAQVGDFEVATSGGFWVAIRAFAKTLSSAVSLHHF
jgi:hypothetical protein